jgi:hypothetical protein
MNNMPQSPLLGRLRLVKRLVKRSVVGSVVGSVVRSAARSAAGLRGTLRRCAIGVTACGVVGALSGCAIQPWVQPYERERLADPIMQWQREGLAQMHREHIHAVREGARGATGVHGGGCGCN